MFILPNLLAQQSPLPGYIIQSGQDTIRGYLAESPRAKNPLTISFATSLQGPFKTLGTSELTGFGVQDEHYLSATVPVDVSPTKTSELSRSPTPTLQEQTVFLRVLVSGPKSLYSLRDQSDKEHFYIHLDGQYQLLTNYRYLASREGQETAITQDRFKQQLQNYLPDCPAVQRQIPALPYSPKALTKLLTTYYAQCTTEAPALLQRGERVRVQMGLLLGGSSTKVSFRGSNHPYLTNVNLPRSTQLTGGLSLDVLLPKRRFSIRNELLYTSFQVKSHYEEYTNANDYALSDVTLGYDYLKLNHLLRYHIPLQSMHLFLNVGLSNGLALTQTNQRRREAFFYSEQGQVTEGQALAEVRAYEQGLLLGLGAGVKRYALEVRYEASNGMSAFTNLSSPVQRFYALLAYRF
ncbi:hypothetical protein GCM10027275_21780 [Rhabdobacter roseus]|uniref:Outer membrane protein beta-barrel domain-containing protein n=1 Tax=Rhabdobacter roseus TaxID=1655419 RepID=A0A840TL21_9BACT|nr:outer membrane beta-barrel protein [Rhabdobacter roseus]MBB5284114.1 hypothetical protein [Rhabdobacter roseus]